MYTDHVLNRNSSPALLLRQSFRDQGKIKKRTLANLLKWPDPIIEGLRILLKGGLSVPSLGDAFTILRSRSPRQVASRQAMDWLLQD